ncbi:MAG: hypothetical protein VYA20_00755 [Candidatus Neomarinimicrobiota bacterium]|nr:hypothetical protein [Candidatus Neomarinimicrobiota bacterium]
MKKFILLFLCSFLVGQTEISMVSTSNVFAEYYDCGCPNNPLGGVARKAHFINTMMKGKDPIIFDAGNMLFDSNEVNPDKLSLKNKQYKAENLVRTMELLDHDVINVGSNDFKGGLDFLKKISSRTRIKFLSANLYDKNGKLLFSPYHIVSSQGLNVGIIGLSEATKHNSVINKDFVSEGNKNIDNIIDSVDIVVLLINITDDNSIDLAKAFPRADYIFLSGVKYRTESKTVQGQDGPLIYAGGIQGKHLSIVDLSLTDPTTAINDASPSFYRMLVIKDRLDKYQRKNPSKTLKEIYANQPGMLQLIGNYVTEFNEIKESLQEGYDNRNLFSSIPMYKSMPEDKEVAAFVDKIAHAADFTFHEEEHQH